VVSSDRLTPVRRRWSYEEFAALPDERKRNEIIDGEVYETPTPSPKHQVISMRLSVGLGTLVDTHRLGDLYAARIDVILNDEHFVEPDLVFIRRERRAIVTERAIEGTPDLIIEIASPVTAVRDRGIKRACYAECGVPLYWVVDADLRQIEVYRFAAAPDGPPEIVRDTLVWQPVPGGPELRIDLAAVFRGFD
jgi:Uma2 family endonuclease